MHNISEEIEIENSRKKQKIDSEKNQQHQKYLEHQEFLYKVVSKDIVASFNEQFDQDYKDAEIKNPPNGNWNSKIHHASTEML